LDRDFFFFYRCRALSYTNTALLSLGELYNVVMDMFLKLLFRVLQLKILKVLWKWVFDTIVVLVWDSQPYETYTYAEETQLLFSALFYVQREV
jgi:hypothetical protein